MTGELIPARIDFKTAGPDFWRRYHVYRRLRHDESRPDDPMRPDEIEEKKLKRDSPFDFEYHYEITKDGVLLSWFSGSTLRPGTPEYESSGHLFWADIFVRPDHRRKGIGSSWAAQIVELMDVHGCTKVGFSTEEAPRHAFLKSLGAEAKLVERRTGSSSRTWTGRWSGAGSMKSRSALRRPASKSMTGPYPRRWWTTSPRSCA